MGRSIHGTGLSEQLTWTARLSCHRTAERGACRVVLVQAFSRAAAAGLLFKNGFVCTEFALVSLLMHFRCNIRQMPNRRVIPNEIKAVYQQPLFMRFSRVMDRSRRIFSIYLDAL